MLGVLGVLYSHFPNKIGMTFSYWEGNGGANDREGKGFNYKYIYIYLAIWHLSYLDIMRHPFSRWRNWGLGNNIKEGNSSSDSCLTRSPILIYHIPGVLAPLDPFSVCVCTWSVSYSGNYRAWNRLPVLGGTWGIVLAIISILMTNVYMVIIIF